jgi:hypothetical protein
MKPWILLAVFACSAASLPQASAHGSATGERGHATVHRAAPVHRVAPVVRVRPAPVIVHGGFGYGWGVPFGAWWSGWPGPPVVYRGPVVLDEPSVPPVYVEQGTETPAAPVAGYWYWCEEPQGYFPDVRECPGAWQPVMPRVEQSP